MSDSFQVLRELLDRNGEQAAQIAQLEKENGEIRERFCAVSCEKKRWQDEAIRLGAHVDMARMMDRDVVQVRYSIDRGLLHFVRDPQTLVREMIANVAGEFGKYFEQL